MSSISLSLKMTLAATACAGLTLLACGDDSGGGDTTDDSKTSSKTDAGKKDAGKDAAAKDAGISVPMVSPGDECDTTSQVGRYGGRCEDDACDEPPCYAQCEGETYGDCKSQSELIGSLLGDGGLAGFLGDSGITIPDAGISVDKDGGLSIAVGDASVEIPATECPDTLKCDGTVGQIIGMNVNLCIAKDAILPTPPSCTTTDDCKAMGLESAPCQSLGQFGSVCFAVCKP